MKHPIKEGTILAFKPWEEVKDRLQQRYGEWTKIGYEHAFGRSREIVAAKVDPDGTTYFLTQENGLQLMVEDEILELIVKEDGNYLQWEHGWLL